MLSGFRSNDGGRSCVCSTWALLAAGAGAFLAVALALVVAPLANPAIATSTCPVTGGLAPLQVPPTQRSTDLAAATAAFLVTALLLGVAAVVAVANRRSVEQASVDDANEDAMAVVPDDERATQLEDGDTALPVRRSSRSPRGVVLSVDGLALTPLDSSGAVRQAHDLAPLPPVVVFVDADDSRRQSDAPDYPISVFRRDSSHVGSTDERHALRPNPASTMSDFFASRNSIVASTCAGTGDAGSQCDEMAQAAATLSFIPSEPPPWTTDDTTTARSAAVNVLLPPSVSGDRATTLSACSALQGQPPAPISGLAVGVPGKGDEGASRRAVPRRRLAPTRTVDSDDWMRKGSANTEVSTPAGGASWFGDHAVGFDDVPGEDTAASRFSLRRIVLVMYHGSAQAFDDGPRVRIRSSRSSGGGRGAGNDGAAGLSLASVAVGGSPLLVDGRDTQSTGGSPMHRLGRGRLDEPKPASAAAVTAFAASVNAARELGLCPTMTKETRSFFAMVLGFRTRPDWAAESAFRLAAILADVLEPFSSQWAVALALTDPPDTDTAPDAPDSADAALGAALASAELAVLVTRTTRRTGSTVVQSATAPPQSYGPNNDSTSSTAPANGGGIDNDVIPTKHDGAGCAHLAPLACLPWRPFVVCTASFAEFLAAMGGPSETVPLRTRPIEAWRQELPSDESGAATGGSMPTVVEARGSVVRLYEVVRFCGDGTVFDRNDDAAFDAYASFFDLFSAGSARTAVDDSRLRALASSFLLRYPRCPQVPRLLRLVLLLHGLHRTPYYRERRRPWEEFSISISSASAGHGSFGTATSGEEASADGAAFGSTAGGFVSGWNSAFMPGSNGSAGAGFRERETSLVWGSRPSLFTIASTPHYTGPFSEPSRPPTRPNSPTTRRLDSFSAMSFSSKALAMHEATYSTTDASHGGDVGSAGSITHRLSVRNGRRSHMEHTLKSLLDWHSAPTVVASGAATSATAGTSHRSMSLAFERLQLPIAQPVSAATSTIVPSATGDATASGSAMSKASATAVAVIVHPGLESARGSVLSASLLSSSGSPGGGHHSPDQTLSQVQPPQQLVVHASASPRNHSVSFATFPSPHQQQQTQQNPQLCSSSNALSALRTSLMPRAPTDSATHGDLLTRRLQAILRTPAGGAPSTPQGIGGSTSETSEGAVPPACLDDSWSDVPDEVLDSLIGALAPPQSVSDDWGVIWRRSDTLIGRGTSGAVYVAMKEGAGALVAMKCIPVSFFRDDSSDAGGTGRALQALRSEVIVLATMKHASLVEYYSFAVTQHFVVILMEYVSGGSLSDLVTAFGALSRATCARYLSDILSGLAFLHSNGVVHCDIKPPNVLVSMSGRCKLGDFGTARAGGCDPGSVGSSLRARALSLSVATAASPPATTTDDGADHRGPLRDDSLPLPVGTEDAAAASASTSGKGSINSSSGPSSDGSALATNMGGGAGTAVAGSPVFMAPEQARGSVEKASDIWGIGMVAYYLLTATLPYRDEDLQLPPLAFLLRLGQGTLLPAVDEVSRTGVTLDSDSLDFIRQCFTVDPTKRPTAAELFAHPLCKNVAGPTFVNVSPRTSMSQVG